MTEERCKHELIVGQCADCGPVPKGLARHVWQTAGGSVFHVRPDCLALLEAQRLLTRAGRDVHDPRRVHVVDALERGRGACLVCFPRYRRQSRAKRCRVRVGDRWVRGQLVEWHRQPDGRWRGVVTYVLDGRTVSETRDQDDLRRG